MYASFGVALGKFYVPFWGGDEGVFFPYVFTRFDWRGSYEAFAFMGTKVLDGYFGRPFCDVQRREYL